MAKFRLHARIPALVLLLAFLAPIFVTVLPVPAMSAEQQLLADIATNYCAESGKHQQSGDQNLPADRHQCCILCATSNHVGVSAGPVPVIEAALNRLQQPEQHTTLQNILKSAPPLEWASPRGPPTNLAA